MNSRNRKIYSLLTAVIILGGCAKRERYTTTISRSWPAAAIHRLEIREVSGTVTVDGAATDTVTLTETRFPSDAATDDTTSWCTCRSSAATK